MSLLWHDVRVALRAFRRAPAFALLVTATLAVGIGGAVAMFTVADGILFSELPYRDSDRLAVIWNRHAATGTDKVQISGPDFLDYRGQISSFEELVFIHNATDNTLTDGGRAEQVDVGYVSANFFPFLGVGAVVGRALAPEDNPSAGTRMGEARPAVISHGLWARRYGSDADVLGRVVYLSGQPVQIVGVLPRDFQLVLPYAEGGAMSSGANDPVDVWRVLPTQAFPNMPRSMAVVRVLGRLAPGATMQGAQGEFDALAARLRGMHRVHRERETRIDVVPLQADVVGHVRATILALFAAVGVVLLIACANVANLVSVQTNGRAGEVALRLALGAHRGRILRQLFTEYALLAGVGALLGLGIAQVLIQTIVGIAPSNVPLIDRVGIDLRAVAVAILSACGAALVFGLWPALKASGVSPSTQLTAASRGVVGRGNRFRNGMVAVEIALSLALLVSGGLLIRTFLELQRTALGFEPAKVLTAKVALGHGTYDDEALRRQYWEELRRELERNAAVQSVGLVWPLPFTGQGAEIPYNDTGSDSEDWGRFLAFTASVSPGYFETVGADVVGGRVFGERDLDRADETVVVDDLVAERLFPGGSAVGRTLWVEAMRSRERRPLAIIGVVRHIRHSSLTRAERDVIFRLAPAARTLAVVLRPTGGIESAVPELRRITGALDRDVPLFDERSLASYVGDEIAPARFTMTLAAAFGVAALMLAVVGLYGVVSYQVSQYREELGVRMALGADEGSIMRWVMGRGAISVGLGMAAGLALAFATARATRSLLFGVPAYDPVTFVATVGLLVASALVALYIPARRAARLDPVVTLREG